jgi:hypothetical protein
MGLWGDQTQWRIVTRLPELPAEDPSAENGENGENRDNQDTVRPRHVRQFPDGLWGMILENARERMYLGVHWIFDAFAVKKSLPGSKTPDFGRNIGGVVLGLKIAEDIFAAGNGKAPKMTVSGTAVPPIPTPPPSPDAEATHNPMSDFPRSTTLPADSACQIVVIFT